MSIATIEERDTYRVIRKPNGAYTSLAAYCESWRDLRGVESTTQINGWQWFPVSAREVLQDIREGVHDRINRHIPYFGIGRRWSAQYQAGLIRDHVALRLIAQRVRVYQFETPEIRRRLSHLLSTWED